MGCPPVRGDNPRALASGLSYVHVDKHGITIYCLPPTSMKTLHILRYFVLKLVRGGIKIDIWCLRRSIQIPQQNIRENDQIYIYHNHRPTHGTMRKDMEHRQSHDRRIALMACV